MNYNNLQQIASDIGGYTHYNNEFEGARDDGYYTQENKKEKLNYIVDFSVNVDGVKIINQKEAEKIYNFLENSNGQNSYEMFEELKN